jgi:hypothetical protein
MVAHAKTRSGMLIPLPAITLNEQREERRVTLKERCETAASFATNHNGASVIWCHLDDEGDTLEKIIPGSVQVHGRLKDDIKEELLIEFGKGNIKTLVTKAEICGLGLNWQHCHNTITFPSYSYMKYYQLIRRFWRYGQNHPVTVSIITTPGEARVMQGLKVKARQANEMHDAMVGCMKEIILPKNKESIIEEHATMPSWI